jgi:hypothetical protein
MILSRARLLIRAGLLALAMGVLLWWGDALPSPIADVSDVLQILLLVSGALLLLTGCVMFSAKALPTMVLLVGGVTSAVSLLVVPLGASLLHFEPNIHNWTGLLLFIWLLLCFLCPVILGFGIVRFIVQRRQEQCD